jgi:hypothetical protein
MIACFANQSSTRTGALFGCCCCCFTDDDCDGDVVDDDDDKDFASAGSPTCPRLPLISSCVRNCGLLLLEAVAAVVVLFRRNDFVAP